MLTDEQYYDEDSGAWGNYQYTTLEEIVNNYMMSISSDDYTASFNRYQILFQARRGLRELYYDVLREVKGIALDLSPTLQVVLPPDYVNYVRISWVDSNGVMYPMAVDNRIPIAEEYLQGSNYELLFDDDGCTLKADSTVIKGSTPEENPNLEKILSSCSYRYSFCESGYQPNRDMSKVFSNGKYKIDKELGVIQFGSDAKGKTIVLEYISDGLYEGCGSEGESQQRVNKFAETTLYDYIYYELIKRLRNVPANEKARAKKEFYNARRIAKMRINTLRKDELLQIFKGSSKNIK